MLASFVIGFRVHSFTKFLSARVAGVFATPKSLMAVSRAATATFLRGVARPCACLSASSNVCPPFTFSRTGNKRASLSRLRKARRNSSG